uniref:Uncharacterized protein n=1 Tax=Glossina austeni TaxID=7395 RepID=A0A1A9VRV7_GLOAU
MNRILTPSSLPCKKCTAPERCIPGRNHTGCVNSRRSTRPKSQGGESSEPRDVSLDVSPSAKIPPSELDTRDPVKEEEKLSTETTADKFECIIFFNNGPQQQQQQQQKQGIMLINFLLQLMKRWMNEVRIKPKQQDRLFVTLTLTLAVAKMLYDFSGNTAFPMSFSTHMKYLSVMWLLVDVTIGCDVLHEQSKIYDWN